MVVTYHVARSHMLRP